MDDRLVPFQIFQSLGVVGDNRSNNLTIFQLRTVTAGRNALFQRTLANFTETVAKYRFHSLNAAALTVDMFRQNGSLIQLGPQFRGFFTPFMTVPIFPVFLIAKSYGIVQRTVFYEDSKP